MASPEKPKHPEAIQFTLEGDWGIPEVRPEDIIEEPSLDSSKQLSVAGSDQLRQPERLKKPTMAQTLVGLWRDNRGIDFLDCRAIRNDDVAGLLEQVWNILRILPSNQAVYTDSSEDGAMYGVAAKPSHRKGSGFYVEKGQDYGILSVIRPLSPLTVRRDIMGHFRFEDIGVDSYVYAHRRVLTLPDKTGTGYERLFDYISRMREELRQR